MVLMYKGTWFCQREHLIKLRNDYMDKLNRHNLEITQIATFGCLQDISSINVNTQGVLLSLS